MRTDGAHGTALFPTQGSAGSPESRRWADQQPARSGAPGAGARAPFGVRHRNQSGMRRWEGSTSCLAYAGRNLPRKFAGSLRCDGDSTAADRSFGYFRPPTAERLSGRQRAPRPAAAGSSAPHGQLGTRAAPPPALRLGQSRAPAGDPPPRPLEVGLTSLRVGAGPWPPAGCGRGAGGPRSGGFRTVWEQRRSHRPGPSQTSVSEFPPCAGAASNVRARLLFSCLADLTFRGLPEGKFAVSAGPLWSLPRTSL